VHHCNFARRRQCFTGLHNNNYGKRSHKAVRSLQKQSAEACALQTGRCIASDQLSGTVGTENTFGTCVGRVKSGDNDYARFLHGDLTCKIRGLPGKGLQR